MKVGDYVRTPFGIWKLELIRTQAKKYTHHLIKQYNGFTIFRNVEEKRIVKSSPNIIDLIEVGDYVNGIKITSVYDDDKEANDYNLKHKKCLGTNVYDEDYQEKLIYEEDIKSIVTKEQFESMEYKIGE